MGIEHGAIRQGPSICRRSPCRNRDRTEPCTTDDIQTLRVVAASQGEAGLDVVKENGAVGMQEEEGEREKVCVHQPAVVQQVVLVQGLVAAAAALVVQQAAQTLVVGVVVDHRLAVVEVEGRKLGAGALTRIVKSWR